MYIYTRAHTHTHTLSIAYIKDWKCTHTQSNMHMHTFVAYVRDTISWKQKIGGTYLLSNAFTIARDKVDQLKWQFGLSKCFLHLHEIVEGLYFYFSLSVCLCVCVCVCVSVCPEFLWTKFQPNGCTDLDAFFAKWLLITLAQTLLNLVTLGQRSRSLWPKMYVKMMKKIRQKFKSRQFWNEISSFDWKFHCRHFDTKYDHIAQKIIPKRN